ncbi:2734_t:CDS:2 [Ambispora gerdemannii]|uniref:2734_t:CDS:1 n=1 Tax=Ambispora gerdemannii TaxID=144530 RepID=A0A9N9AZ47_9GLOM|nr:2734_t:CDS:2 [Ambispora gerdemannii]
MKNFGKEIEQLVLEWERNVRAKHKSDVLYVDDPLLVIEWNETGLQQRGIQKIAMLNRCPLIPCSRFLRVESLFFVVKTGSVGALQRIQFIINVLQDTYLQRHVPTLGRIYQMVAQKNNMLWKLSNLIRCLIFDYTM